MKGTVGYVRTAPFWYPELDELPGKMESEEHRVRKAVAAQLKEQMKDKPESADPKKMEQLVKEAGDKALKDDAAYQKPKRNPTGTCATGIAITREAPGCTAWWATAWPRR